MESLATNPPGCAQYSSFLKKDQRTGPSDSSLPIPALRGLKQELHEF